MRLTLTRTSVSDEGTFGSLTGEGLLLYTAELPWKNNAKRVSCIMPGSYICRPYSSARFPNVYEVTKVPGRSAILIHSGNHAGDVSKGLRSDVEGCILVGTGMRRFLGQTAAISSRLALNQLRAAIGKNKFELVIINRYGVRP